MTNWKVIVDDDKVNLFPFVYWPDAYSTGWKEIIGKNLEYTLLEFNNSKFRYCIDGAEWKETAEKVFSKIKDTDFGEKLIEMNEKKVNALYDYCRALLKKDFSKLSDKQLKKTNQKYSEKMIEANRAGLFISILEYENNILSDYLEKIIKEKTQKTGENVTAPQAFATLVTPLKDNLMQQELSEYHTLLEEFRQNKNIAQKAREHTKKFCWIRYNYEGPAFTNNDLLQKLEKDAELGKKDLQRIPKKDILKAQNELAKKLQLSSAEQRLFSLAREYMFWKTFRRDVQSFAFFVFEAFQREIAKRFGFSLKEVRQMHYSEVNDLLDGKNFDKKELWQRSLFSVYLLEKGFTSILSGKKAVEKAQEITQEALDHKTNILRGNCAMPGKAMGIARIINSQAEFFKLKESEILVSFATTPDMSSIIKKAGAIVTDQGGITCHAAIVSRELKIPCVVGTKIATKIIKDGEKIEVDASNGTVKRLFDENF